MSADMVDLCCEWITAHARPRITRNGKAFAYQLKHEVERWRPGTYVPVEDFIAAAAKCGYPSEDKDVGYRMRLWPRNRDYIVQGGETFFLPWVNGDE